MRAVNATVGVLSLLLQAEQQSTGTRSPRHAFFTLTLQCRGIIPPSLNLFFLQPCPQEMQQPASSPVSPSRPPKKKRVENAGVEEPSKRLLFDLLEDNALENVTRLTSSNPNRGDWPMGIHEDAVSVLYEIESYYEKFIASRFDSIYSSPVRNPFRGEHDTGNGLLINNPQLAYNILMRTGENIKKIHWDDSEVEDYFPFGDKMAELSTKCTNLESLSFGYCDAYIPWIKTFGHQLRSVSFHNRISHDIIGAVGSHCTEICELNISPMFSLDTEWSNLWRTIGRTLQVLSLELCGHGEEHLPEIEKYCRKLKRIDIRGDFPPFAGLARCLASFGDQLEYATIYFMEYEDLKHVVEKCTNARFDILLRGDNSGDSLMMGGKQLERVSFPEVPERTVERFELTKGWDSCTNMQELIIRQLVNHRELGLIFNSPKVHLRKVQLNFNDEGIDLKKVLHAFTQGGITSLESVHFRMRFPQPNLFNKLVEMNKSLCEARLYIFGEEPKVSTMIGRFIEITRCFLDSPRMKNLFIYESNNRRTGFPSVEEMLRAEYRHRRVHVKICSSSFPRTI